MPKNIEIKAKAADWNRQFKRAGEISSSRETLRQKDTFFYSAKGRLKLRELGEGKAQLIFYERADSAGPKTSNYEIFNLKNPETLHRLLSASLGQKALVKKKRTVFFSGQTRIHFDEVEGLGKFIELEVVMKPGQSLVKGQAEAKRIMAELGIRAQDLLQGAYADLQKA